LIRYKKLSNAAKPKSMFSSLFKKNTIHPIIFILLYLAAVFMLSNCEDDSPRPRSYPRINTMPVSEITANGAVFTAELYSLGTEVILNYGFVWAASEPNIKSSNKILLGPRNETGIFSAAIVTNLQKDKEYTVKSFVQTADHIVYGIPVKFKSLGSGAPQVTGFKPSSAAWEDTLIVSGRNFSWVAGDNIVKLNNTICPALSSTDTTLKVLVSYELPDLKSVLSVTLSGNTGVFTKDTFRLIPPVLKDFNPKQARWGDTLILSGKGLSTFSYKSSNSVKLGPYLCILLNILNDSSIAVKIPYEINTIASDLSLLINGFTLPGNQSFQLKAPEFSFTPKEGTWGNTIKLDGNFNTIVSRNSVFFDDVQATIVTSSAKELKVRIPESLSKIKTNIVYNVTPFTVVSADTFRLEAPLISTFSPSAGPGGTAVEIKGKYFSISNTSVMFGSARAVILFINDSIINVTVPERINGPVKISVSSKLQSVVSDDYFTVTNPVITSVIPLSGTFNDEITIEGANFIPPNGSTTVYFDEIQASVASLTATSIVVHVPPSVDSIPRAIKVISGENSTTSAEKFTLLPPVIYSISPATLVSGEDVVISGKNFSPEKYGNKVLLDLCYLTIKSANSTQIVATVPQSLPRGVFKMKVITGGYSRFSVQEFTINSQWLRIPSPILKVHNGIFGSWISVAGGGLKNYGYLCSIVDNGLTYRFDPSTYSWAKLGTNANVDISNGNWNLDQVICQDTAYIIAGMPSVLIGIDQVNETWQNKSVTIPYTNEGIVFSLNKKIYFGYKRDYSYSSSEFYEIDPSNNYSKTKTTDFPGTLAASITSYFSVGNKGYVLFSDNNFWQFDGESHLWTRLNDFPGAARFRAISFVIGDYGYMGTGVNGATLFNDIWKYDPLLDSWTFVSSIPNPRYYAVAITINGKAYIGYGILEYPIYNNIDLFDFYEFDPNYPLK
jgi:hypothetical protein